MNADQRIQQRSIALRRDIPNVVDIGQRTQNLFARGKYVAFTGSRHLHRLYQVLMDVRQIAAGALQALEDANDCDRD